MLDMGPSTWDFMDLCIKDMKPACELTSGSVEVQGVHVRRGDMVLFPTICRGVVLGES